MPKIRRARCLLAICLALLFSAAANAAAPQIVIRNYVDARDYVKGTQVDAWYNITWKLKRNFNQICSDTFCGGEFSNIEALRYVCSVDKASGRVGMCTWTFAASDETANPVNGQIIVQQKFWQCRTPLPPRTTIEGLMTALAGNDPLHATLPGSNRTIMDGLIDDCFF